MSLDRKSLPFAEVAKDGTPSSLSRAAVGWETREGHEESLWHKEAREKSLVIGYLEKTSE